MWILKNDSQFLKYCRLPSIRSERTIETKKAKHAFLVADCSGPKEVAINEIAAIESSGVNFCTNHFRSRLMSLKEEMDHLFKALSMMGVEGSVGFGP